MKRVKVGDFRDRASELTSRTEHGETLIIANRDRDVAKIVPIAVRAGSGLAGSLAGTARIAGDIEVTIALPDAWFRNPA
jgi:antitoxin (DNA-binding transcriptional repressor) of toxin-antitoxin stability system